MGFSKIYNMYYVKLKESTFRGYGIILSPSNALDNHQFKLPPATNSMKRAADNCEDSSDGPTKKRVKVLHQVPALHCEKWFNLPRVPW